MGHCYVHFAFLFTLIHILYLATLLCILTNILYRHMNYILYIIITACVKKQHTMYSQCTILQSYTKIQILYNSDKDNVLILKTHNVDLVYRFIRLFTALYP